MNRPGALGIGFAFDAATNKLTADAGADSGQGAGVWMRDRVRRPMPQGNLYLLEQWGFDGVSQWVNLF